MALAMLEPSRPDELAAQVKEYRSVLGWSQQELADRAGCSRPTIARLEAGRVILSLTMNKVIDALNEGLAAAAHASADASSDNRAAQVSTEAAPESSQTPPGETPANTTQSDSRESSYAAFGPVFSEGK